MRRTSIDIAVRTHSVIMSVGRSMLFVFVGMYVLKLIFVECALDLFPYNNLRLFRPFWPALHFLKAQQYIYIASF